MLRRHSSIILPIIALFNMCCLTRNYRAARVFYELLENYRVRFMRLVVFTF